MGRPRQHDLDDLLDHARRLWVDGGSAALTVRALAAASGASNGAIYHAFGSRDALLARVWTREARRFLHLQAEAVETALAGGDPRAAVVAAALAPCDLARRDAAGARLLLAVTADDLLAAGPAAPERDELRALRRDLHALVVRLAVAVWGSDEPPATTLVGSCLVALPSALLLGRGAEDRLVDPVARLTLERAVLGVLSAPPPTADRAVPVDDPARR